MGWVYEVHDRRLDIRVAVKVFRSDDGMDASSAARFVREARVAARLESAHIAKVHDFGVLEDRGIPFIVFELLHGQDFEHLLAAASPLPISLAVDYLLQALVGVAAAHAEGIAHRDLKPANLFLVERQGQPVLVKVLDFGVAKALKGREIDRAPTTRTDEVFGTPLYMAPEQLLSAKRVDERADIWSLGVILYELLTKARPFDGATFGELLSSMMEGIVVPPERHRPDVPPALSAIILRCLERERERRFPSVFELATALVPFGSPSASAELEEIQSILRENTEKRNLDSELAATIPDNNAPFASTWPLASLSARSLAGRGASPVLPAVIIGVLSLIILVVAGAVGYLLGR
jgi:serine/threonine-protein kinase